MEKALREWDRLSKDQPFLTAMMIVLPVFWVIIVAAEYDDGRLYLSLAVHVMLLLPIVCLAGFLLDTAKMPAIKWLANLLAGGVVVMALGADSLPSVTDTFWRSLAWVSLIAALLAHFRASTLRQYPAFSAWAAKHGLGEDDYDGKFVKERAEETRMGCHKLVVILAVLPLFYMLLTRL